MSPNKLYKYILDFEVVHELVQAIWYILIPVALL